MKYLEKFLPLARDESKVERQEHPDKCKGQWVVDREVTAANREACEVLVKFGNFRISD